MEKAEMRDRVMGVLEGKLEFLEDDKQPEHRKQTIHCMLWGIAQVCTALGLDYDEINEAAQAKLLREGV